MKILRQLVAVALATAACAAIAQIKIGVTVSSTGPAASLGIPEKNTVELLPREIAGKKVEYIVLDDASDTTATVTNTRKLINDEKVDAIIGSTTTPNSLAFAGVLPSPSTGSNDRGDESREFRRRPAGVLRQFRVDEIKPVERMILVLDAPEHVHTADLAGVALDGGTRIDDREIVGVFGHRHGVARHHRNHGEQGALGLPALRAAAGMIVGGLCLDAYLDGLSVHLKVSVPPLKFAEPGLMPLSTEG